MPQTYRDYDIWDVVLATFHGRTSPEDESDGERVRRGDIVAVRRAGWGNGTMTLRRYLWLRVYGSDADFMRTLADPFDDNPHHGKRRYSIPLARLKQVYPQLDTDAARDDSVIYQPFLPSSDDGYIVARSVSPLSIYGLVFDNKTRRYI